MDMHDRLKSWRESKGMSQADLAERLGTTEQSIGRYERGERPPKANHFRTLAELGCDPTWLVTGTSSNAAPAASSPIAPVKFVQIPKANVHLSAGHGLMPPNSEQIQWVEFDEEWVRHATGRNPRNLVMAEAEGNSMEPTIVDGDEMLIDVTDKRLTNGKIYALSVSEVLVVKRIHLSVSGVVRLISDNKDYEPEEISHTASAEMQVIGQVVWWSHRAR